LSCSNAVDLICNAKCRLIDSDVGGGRSKRPVSCMMVGGDRRQTAEDDEVSVVSDDGGDDEINRNGNVWPRSGVQVQSYYRKLAVWKNVIRGVEQIFHLAEVFREMISQFAIANQFSYRLERNSKQRIVVRCKATECPFYMCVRGGKNTTVMWLKDYNGQHKHNVGEMCEMGVWGRRRVRAELLAHLIEGKVRLCLDYSPRDIMQDLELELGIRLTYMQSWRAREFVRMMVLGRPEDHYKLLLWMCAAIVRANSDSVAFCEVEECHFQRMFVAYAANINGFKLGCRIMLFVDGCHLSGPYKGTLLAACALDADNHLFNFAYGIVSCKSVEDWVWFLQCVA